MGKIFNRISPEFDIYEFALQNAQVVGEDHLSIAINLAHDFRVCNEREFNFRNSFNGNLKASLDDYFDTYIKNVSHPDIPDFCRDTYRIAECAFASGYCCAGFDKNMKLSTVMNLNALFQPFKEALNQFSTLGKISSWLELKDALQTDTDRRFNTIIALSSMGEFDRWLTTQFVPYNQLKIENLIQLFFKVLNELKSENKPYKPVFWVTDWDKLKEYIAINPTNIERWNQSVGVPNKFNGWQIVIQYPTSAVKCLYRPTQLDGGFFPEHFPPPPNVEEFYGGFTMDLVAENYELLPEFIHQQLDEFKIEYWKNTGLLIGRVYEKIYDLLPLRQTHFNKLESKYADVNIWMANPNILC